MTIPYVHASGPNFRLYTDVLQDDDRSPVYLELAGATDLCVRTDETGRTWVSVAIPPAVWEAIRGYPLRDQETSEYLTSIADISARIRPFEELASEARGCPDPEFYGGEAPPVPGTPEQVAGGGTAGREERD